MRRAISRKGSAGQKTARPAQVPLAMKYVELALGRARVNVDVIDSSYRVRYMDPLWARRYGGNVIGKKCYRLFAGRRTVCPDCGIRRAMRTGKVVVYESTLPREKNKPIEVLAVPFRDERGTVMVAEINVDIAKRKQAEEVLRRDKETLERLVADRSRELLAAHEKLERGDRLAEIGTLAASIAHELRNPLAAIRTAAFNVRRKSADGALTPHLDNIDRKVLESDRIINNLLFYSRIGLPDLATIDICAILDECLERVRERYRDHQLTVIRNYKGPCIIAADPVQMSEVFNNLLNNACESLPEKKGILTVSVSAGRPKRGFIAISVTDSGIGIPEEALLHIHEPFYSTKKIGTGLGLPICFKIVELHRGRIEVRSEPGRETTFTVIVPVGNEKRRKKSIKRRI